MNRDFIISKYKKDRGLKADYELKTGDKLFIDGVMDEIKTMNTTYKGDGWSLDSLMTFGKYKGFHISIMDKQYVLWLLSKDNIDNELKDFLSENLNSFRYLINPFKGGGDMISRTDTGFGGC
jgi:uncharacterized protein (DUF3820 family)|tara:strand:- start:260 stop:625 length:366 start_codon:yes stop_codon:yes gene_type:complete